eukprot:CAMPEP_0198499000 /NCGR_PEP_ID=MMETSP1462-20131121/7348_1 /TAXON_ID=1333877 /ORGANISM="Brandtodinium nutriculum, Strain RCC3387" /LENGTH=51 /DNA_ID=CAMNT_0044227953 /DNA_START=48 /DNA_END=200 /DNA_ORIENTATION=+
MAAKPTRAMSKTTHTRAASGLPVRGPPGVDDVLVGRDEGPVDDLLPRGHRE